MKVVDICKSLVEEGLHADKNRGAEREMFMAAHRMAQEANKTTALASISSYESQKAEVCLNFCLRRCLVSSCCLLQ